MRRAPLFWHLFAGYFVITLCATLIVTWGTWLSLRQFYYLQTRSDLNARAQLVAGLADGHLKPVEYTIIDTLSKQIGTQAATRITVILPTGQVIADSEHDIATMANHSDRPEIITALTGTTGDDIRKSDTLSIFMMYVAVPIKEGTRIVGVARAAIPLTAYNEALGRLHNHVIVIALLVALAAIIASLLVARHVSRPLVGARRMAERYARGDLQERLPVAGPSEIAGLSEAMNEMAGQLDDRIRTITRQRTEQQAMLLSMSEGMLAVDNEECILRVNQAAATLMGIDAERTLGRTIQETIRSITLQRFVADVLAGRDPQEAEIILTVGEESRWIQLHGTLLHDEAENRIGALVVMNDVTRLYRLETVRRDFVANVSHELKTPITSIKGFVESLLEGSLSDPTEAERFLKIIARQTDRMNEIIEDLLVLSSLEQRETETGITLTIGSINEVVQVAIQACSSMAATKDIHLSFTGQPEYSARIDAALLEQAVVNLIDNAIKYSETGSSVTITLEKTDTYILLHVSDNGIGIAMEHLPRIFERFYRVDPGRSRKLGGTGLGLAIVKHIVKSHGGEVTVESTLGNGSTFTIHFPIVE